MPLTVDIDLPADLARLRLPGPSPLGSKTCSTNRTPADR